MWVLEEKCHPLIEIRSTNQIVTVEWQNEFAACEFDTRIPRPAESLVGLVKNPVFVCIEILENLARSWFIRSVVNNDYFRDRFAAHLLDAGQRFKQHQALVIAGNYDGNHAVR
jgi:hypothetical protein